VSQLIEELIWLAVEFVNAVLTLDAGWQLSTQTDPSVTRPTS